MKFGRKNKEDMNLDQQIQACETRISQLEHLKHSWHLHSSDNMPSRNNSSPDQQDLEHIEKSLDENYRQMALLKIRRMMGY
jgi:hypothetical protein